MTAPVCRLCGSSNAELLSHDVSEAPESAVYKCRDCEIIYLFPIMTEEEESAFYRASFEKYMAGRSGAGWKSPDAHFHAYQLEGERRLPLVRPFINPGEDSLEIGSSTGYFLDDLRGYGCTVMGVEPSESYRDFANKRGITTVADINELGSKKFDMIFLYYVLEHLRDPIGYLALLHKYLKPGGRVLLEVPNVDDVLLGPYHIPAFGPFYWQKAHYYNYSRTTLLNVFSQAGYQVNLYPAQRYDLSNHIVWMMDGKPGGAGRFRDLFTPELEIVYAEALKKQWKCDTLFAVGRVHA